MAFPHILAFSAIAIISSLLAKGRWRSWMVLIASVAALFWLQPLSPIRYLDFWLPVATLALTVLVWLVVRAPKENPATPEISQSDEAASMQDSGLKPTVPPPADVPDTRRSLIATIALVLVIVLVVGALRYVEPLCCLTASRPPQIWIVALAILVIGALGFGLARVRPGARWKPFFFIVLLIGLLVVLKTETLAQAASAGLRSLMGQSTEYAAALDIRWLGVSYIFFRLIHSRSGSR
jgi:alginate O-acetyltransferase complex protein AlgI